MTFDQLVKIYLVESKQSGPPYIVKNKYSTYYYKDPEHKILHRDEKDPVTGLSLPACEYSDGSKQWFVDGKRHRLDGPAIEYPNGLKYWYVDGKLHRLDGPACEGSDGSKSWLVDGKRHRLDGPAIERINGSKSWYVDDKELTKEEFNEYRARLDAIKKVGKVGNRLSSELIKGLFE